jgi:hypothetical protein
MSSAIRGAASSAAQAGSYTNASPIVAGGLVVAGCSPPEGDPTATGGFSLIDARTGAIVKTTPAIPAADHAKGYSGGGLWSTPAYDPATHYLYFGAGNPSSKDKQHPNTDAILKIDLDRARSTRSTIPSAASSTSISEPRQTCSGRLPAPSSSATFTSPASTTWPTRGR